MPVFPIKLAAYETPNFTTSPYQYREAFRLAREQHDPKRVFYAYDVTIMSRTEVEFTVYDMRDNFSGGIGREIARFDATVSAALTAADVDKAIWRAAEDRRQNELYLAEQAIIAGYAEEIRKEVGE